MSHGNRHSVKRNQSSYHRKQSKVNFGDKGREILENIDESNPVIQQFRKYATELDDKHDRFERIIKVSRDITIESKRAIFLLHTLDKESKKDSVLAEGKAKLDNMSKICFKNVALELEGKDTYQYLKAYKAGLQEYVEAITFYWYLQNNTLPNWSEVQDLLTYTVPQKNKTVEDKPDEMKTIKTLVVPSEYILGIADLTGELMRKCINNLASGDLNSCYQTCNFVREMYKEFLGCVGISGKEINKKLFTLKQSLTKMENVCYTIKVRGSEIPKHMLADVAIERPEEYHMPEEDEGYQAY